MLEKRARSSLVFTTLALAGAACGGQAMDEPVNASEAAVIGDGIGGIAGAEFADAKDNFTAVEGLEDGLGPIFNERSCGACHSNGATGGAGEQIERRYGRFVNGAFDPIAGSGGSLRQLFTVGSFSNPDFHGGPANSPNLCVVPLEREPNTATVHNVGRLATPLFGLGFVDAMPDSFFDTLAGAEPAATRGTVRRVTVQIPTVKFNAGAETGTPQQAVGSTRVARFGWKANVPTLQQFAADAYLNEMGITTQSCIGGRSIVDFAVESAPNGVPVPVGCDDLAPHQSGDDVAATGMQVNTDDSVGSCAGNLTEIQEDIANFAKFMTFLAPVPIDNSDAISIARGRPLFTSIGCANCHVDNTVSGGALATAATFRTPGTTPNGVPGNTNFHPFSDFLIHDMGSLGDQIGVNAGDTVAQSRQMRTAPLWGIRVRNHLLHDGRTSDIPTAVRAHDGQGAAARNAFNALSAANQHNVVQFVRSL